MNRIEAVLSTTRLDTQGERMTKEALESLVKSISRAYIPVGIEHDPRIPPQGRIASGFVREAPDGEYEAVAIMELFDDNDGLNSSGDLADRRELITRPRPSDRLTIAYDWTYRHEADQKEILEIANIFGSTPIYDAKKSIEPISVITIAGAFALGGIASGFFAQVGADLWAKVKEKLVYLFDRKEQRKGEKLLIIDALIDADGRKLEVHLILTNPTPKKLDSLITKSLQVIDLVLPFYLHNSTDIRRFVFEVAGEKVELKFAVRKDCIPLAPSLSVESILKRITKPK